MIYKSVKPVFSIFVLVKLFLNGSTILLLLPHPARDERRGCRCGDAGEVVRLQLQLAATGLAGGGPLRFCLEPSMTQRRPDAVGVVSVGAAGSDMHAGEW
jgi:hypothetical protein